MGSVIQRRDLFWAWTSYALWGFFPIYWKLLGKFPALEVLAHRFIWSFLFYLALFLFRGGQPFARLRGIPRRDLKLSALATFTLAINWGCYIYAVQTGRILEGSLAYFINPLLNVVAGVVFFHETISPLLKIAVASATIGVLLKAGLATEPPWLALILASSFCIYGILKKSLRSEATATSMLEGAFGFLPAMILALYLRSRSSFSINSQDCFLLMGSGIVTGLPLFLFSYAAQRVPYSLMGILQFIAPTLQFAVGVALYGEIFGWRDLAAFGFIWLGVSFYMVNQLLSLKKWKS